MNSIPHQILKEFDVIKTFEIGGSSAKTLLVEDKRCHRKCILKYSTWGGIGSSGLPWLKAQCKRFRELGSIKNHIIQDSLPTILDEYEGKSLYFYLMEYFPNSYPISFYYYQKRQNVVELKEKIDAVISLLMKLYQIQLISPPSNFAHDVHIKRMIHRTNLLTNTNTIVYNKVLRNRPIFFSKFKFTDLTDLFSEIKKYQVIYINGKKHRNFPTLLPEIDNELILSSIQPNVLPKYYHGDSTLRNYLLFNSGIKIIDIRGTDLPGYVVSKIDIAYELGKIVRTFYLEIIRNNDFYIDLVEKGTKLSFGFIFNKVVSASSFIDVRSVFLKSIKKYQDEHEILKMENNLLVKVLYAEAAHFIADAVNRIESDISGKQTIAYYLLGLQLYDELLRRS